jgi:hypothetical protein
MVKRRKVKGDFGFYEKVDLPVAVAAAKAVCLKANDTAEALLFLDMFGLIDPLPENEPVKHKRSAQRRREKQEQIENDTMSRLGVSPEEIGEDA